MMGRKVRRMKSSVSDGEVCEESAAKYGGHLNGEAGGMVSDALIEVFAEFFGLEAE